MHQIVNFCVVANDRVPQSAPVNTAVGADFYIVADDHRANLRHFEILPLAATGHKPKAISADADAREEVTPTANGHAVAEADKALKHRVLAHGHITAQIDVSHKLGTWGHLGAGFDHTIGTHIGLRAHLGALKNAGPGVMALPGGIRRGKKAQHCRHGRAKIFDHQTVTV